MSSSGFFWPLPRRRTTRFFLRASAPSTATSAAAKPAARKRCAMACAAVVTLPTESVVLISISCLKISCASALAGSSVAAAPCASGASTASSTAGASDDTRRVMGSALREQLQKPVEELVALVERCDAEALVAPVRAVTVALDGQAGEGVGGQACRAGVHRIRGAGRHRGDHLKLGPQLPDHLFQRRHQLGQQRRRGKAALIGRLLAQLTLRGQPTDRDGRLGQHLDEYLADLLGGVARQYPAIDDGLGALRQGIVSVPSRHARGP